MPGQQYSLRVGLNTCGIAAGASKVYDVLKETLQNTDVRLQRTGCIGMCYKEPLVEVVSPEGENYLYGKVSPESARRIVEEHINKGTPVDELLVLSPGKKTKDKNFLDKQHHILLKKFGIIDPEDINSYIKTGGYEGIKKVLTGMSPEKVIKEIKISGLRGRGGAGFPVARKWDSARKIENWPKYVVCNGDEGDPGAFMDRSVLEGNPHAVLEGMTIAAYAIGASHGYIYVRAEYPLAVTRLKIAIEQARQKNFLGQGILGTDFNFDLKIFQGAGAFVCGESTALVRSIEGFRGMPKPLPRPRTTEEGLWGKPTLLNNVKTFAFIPEVIINGGDWFASIGTKNSPGTAVFALTGQIKNNGLIEVPMGTTLKEIIFDIGGGIANDRTFKAVQTGGPSGGCLPERLLDLEVDFDSLLEAGLMMGSGGMVVLDESSCMVDMAKHFLQFTVNESCGQCPPCREGTQQMLKILEDITAGNGSLEDLSTLEEMGKGIKTTSICGLGQSAPNPVLSTLGYFRSEYEAHIKDKSCPSLYCKELIVYWIEAEKCKACGLCLKECPEKAITGEKKVPHVIDQTKCTKCGICLDVCPDKFNAVIRLTGKQKSDILEGVK
ncbi:MAG: NADP-reducing hydrogenase subunit HndC [candidate division WS2 bacterium]|uniref:NADH-quinone oxidoreductase subunit F n=1 Tax=Candidatus Hakubella thermalkaliphila TaxID=2754717 RepID=A0A6V8QFC4_9ACTN|nr:NADH-quinone oxidoreductase subunit NuoF [Candidatus Hakubella thermalkaliphila]MBT9165141.1 NADP-reducing hydrogenase subunit HndC [Candidatus Lithacetigena glycinireducens]GFP35165.1 NADH-quinone oxidoreductase subunit F [Candidatus Hakubella thermalkaliphila]GFP43297.1 NADH-quinone oxidoreductase subunit F [Candidatus Hakubella thermalkaliphila]